MADEFGSYKGYSALIPYKHTKENYERKNIPLTFATDSNNTGMFSLLLSKYPELKEYIDILYFGKDKSVLEKNITVRRIHQIFLKKCKEIGIKEYEYPFSVKSKAIRSLYSYIQNLMISNPNKVTSRLSKDAYEKMTSTGMNQCTFLSEIRPFSVVQIDGHKIDCIATIEITTPKGDKETKTIQRFWLLTLIDVATRAILGYHLTVESAYDRFDVLKCIENAILPKKNLNLAIPGLEYPRNTGFHSTALPETEWAVFDEIMLDNALAHLSDDEILDYIEKISYMLPDDIDESYKFSILVHIAITLMKEKYTNLQNYMKYWYQHEDKFSLTKRLESISFRSYSEEYNKEFLLTINPKEKIYKLYFTSNSVK